MTRKNIAITGVIIVVLIFVGITIYISKNKPNQQSNSNISINTQSISKSSNSDTDKQKSDASDTKTDLSSNSKIGISVDLNEVKSELKITKTNSENSKSSVETSPTKSGCQPADFDPETTKFTKVHDENLTPSDFFEIDNPSNPLESSTFQIQDYELAQPLSAKAYIFGCPSQVSSILDIKADGKRIVLIKDIWGIVSQNMFSSDSKYLYIQNIQTEGSNLVQKTQLFDILNQKYIDLGNIPCLGDGFWQDNFIVTNEYFGSAKKRNYDICIFDQKGNNLKQLNYSLEYGGHNQHDTLSNIRLIGYLLSIYKGSGVEGININSGSTPCYLSTYNIKTDSSKEAIISQSDQDGQCPDIDIQKLEENRAVITFK